MITITIMIIIIPIISIIKKKLFGYFPKSAYSDLTSKRTCMPNKAALKEATGDIVYL